MEQESFEISAQVICGQIVSHNYQSHCKQSKYANWKQAFRNFYSNLWNNSMLKVTINECLLFCLYF